MTDYLHDTCDFSSPDLPAALDEVSLWSAQFGNLLLNHLELRPNLKILDVGCGTGFPSLELARIYGSSCYILAVDIWKEALERANFKSTLWGAPNLGLVNADGAFLPVLTGEIDLIVSNVGINNFKDPGKVALECLRVLKSGGKLVLTTNIKGHMREFYDVYKESLVELDKTHYLERLSENENHRGTRESIASLLQTAGFCITKTVADRFQLRYVDGTAMLNHSLTKVGFLEDWRKVVDPIDEKAVFASIESKLNTLARKNGELRMTIPMLLLEAQNP